jgi:hypothetical protein
VIEKARQPAFPHPNVNGIDGNGMHLNQEFLRAGRWDGVKGAVLKELHRAVAQSEGAGPVGGAFDPRRRQADQLMQKSPVQRELLEALPLENVRQRPRSSRYKGGDVPGNGNRLRQRAHLQQGIELRRLADLQRSIGLPGFHPRRAHGEPVVSRAKRRKQVSPAFGRFGLNGGSSRFLFEQSLAPGSTAPEESRTVPCNCAEPVCAEAAAANSANKTKIDTAVLISLL